MSKNIKTALKDAFGIIIPDNIELKTAEETSEHVLVIPANPAEKSDGTDSPNGQWSSIT
jgi:hypothetical protein